MDRKQGQVTFFRIHGTNLEILVHTPGKFASAHPIPQDMIPARKYRPSFPLTCRGPPESPWKLLHIFLFFSILGKDPCLQILIFLQFQRDFQIEYTLIMKRLSVDLKRICSDIIGGYYFIDTWQESWPPLSYPAQRKMSGMNSCLPALRNIDLHLSLLTMGTETCNRHQILVRIKNFSFVT